MVKSKKFVLILVLTVMLLLSFVSRNQMMPLKLNRISITII